MQFIETSVFTRTIVKLLDDDTYRSLQLALLLQPKIGPAIRGSGRIRKLRWSLQRRGKLGGVRIIYFWDEPSETFYMLYAYPKSAREDLTARQLQTLVRLVREEFG